MDRFDRIFRLHQILAAHRYPVSTETLMERLECSRATVMRCIEDMRDHLGAPVTYDRAAGGYHYQGDGETLYELPGLWLNASELQGLLLMRELLAAVEPGLLAESLQPVEARIDDLLSQAGIQPEAARRRIRILPMAARELDPQVLRAAAEALFRRRRLEVDHYHRERDAETRRTLSPHRLVRYRDNWYLDAWCHWRDDLRSFALDALSRPRVTDETAVELEDGALDARLSSAYGIFTGVATATAILAFEPRRARWIARERWHRDQRAEWRADGRYLLHVPYGDPRELVMDLLRFGADVEVLAPAELRAAVARQLADAAALYTRS